MHGHELEIDGEETCLNMICDSSDENNGSDDPVEYQEYEEEIYFYLKEAEVM